MWYLKNIRPICSIAGKKKLFFLPLNELTVPRVFRPYQFCLVILTPFNLHSHAVKKTTTLQRSPTLFRKMLVSKKHVLTTSSPIFYWDKKKKKNITKVKPSNASDSRHWLEVLFKKKTAILQVPVYLEKSICCSVGLHVFICFYNSNENYGLWNIFLLITDCFLPNQSRHCISSYEKIYILHVNGTTKVIGLWSAKNDYLQTMLSEYMSTFRVWELILLLLFSPLFDVFRMGSY